MAGKTYLANKTTVDNHIADKDNPHEVEAGDLDLGDVSPSEHNHDASDINSGTLSSDRLPTVPIEKGGTGATDAATALAKLGGARLGSSGAYFSGIYIGTNGVIPYIYNNGDDDIWFRYKNSAGTTLYTPFSLLMHATGNIPMTGNLLFNQGDVRTGQLGAYLTNLVLTSYGTNTVQFMLDNNTSLYNALKLYFTPNGGSQSAYILYGTHNIPEGYYTGNGSATQRSIEIPSFLRGRCLLVFSDGYTDGVPDTVAIVTPMGGFSKNDSNEVTGFGKDTARFSLDDSTNTGYLVINSTSECFNKNGVKYYYKGL